jgi:hypothetical protein
MDDQAHRTMTRIGEAWRIGPGDPGTPPVSVHGPAAGLLAWLIGRDDGGGLKVAGGSGAPPVLPAWR